MSRWLHESGAERNSQYRLNDVRTFHRAVLRAYHGMRRSQACVKVLLPASIFGAPLEFQHVWCCKVADNTAPRVTCQDREIILRPVRSWLIGVDPLKHKGAWLSRSLIYSFMVGLDSTEIPLKDHICKASIGQRCVGKKANEMHQLMRDLKQEVKKEKKYYDEYEPSPEDGGIYE